MPFKRQQTPLKVSNWIEQNVHIKPCTLDIGAMSKDTRRNVMLNRQFYSNLLNLSSERFRKISRFDFEKKKFLNDQRVKAEKFMPGLLPYIEPYMENISNPIVSPRLSKKNESFNSTSFQSLAAHSTTKAEFSTLTRESTWQKTKIPSVAPQKLTRRQEKSFERNTFVSRNPLPDPNYKPHVRSYNHNALTVDDLFGDLDDDASYNMTPLNKPTSANRDKRFRQLIHMFSEVHECKTSNTKTIKNVIESNSSLKYEQKSCEKMNMEISSINFETSQPLFSDELYKNIDVCLIETVA